MMINILQGTNHSGHVKVLGERAGWLSLVYLRLLALWAARH